MLGHTHSDSRWTHAQAVSIEPQQYRLQFGMVAPIFIPNSGTITIISRGISTVPLDPNPPLQLSYTLITANSPGCINTDQSFTALPPLLEYRKENDQWKALNYHKEGSNMSITDHNLCVLTMLFCIIILLTAWITYMND